MNKCINSSLSLTCNMSKIFTKSAVAVATAGKLDYLVCLLVFVLLKHDPGQCDSDRPPSSYPAHRLHPSIRWCMHISHWSCHTLLRSDTGSAADSQLHKTPQGILGENIQKEHVFHPSITCLCAGCFCVFTHLLCSWVQSSLACTRTAHWPGGRCHCYGSYRSGYILPHRNQRGMLPESDNNIITSA